MAISRYEPSVARVANDAIYGTGVDGEGVVTVDTTITSDMYYNNLTVNSGVVLNTNGFRIFVKNTLTLNGYIGVGSVSGGVVGPAASSVSGKTISGHSTGAITYRAGGQGGGSSITALPSFLYKDINAMSKGLFMHTSGMIVIGGGSAGAAGAAGATIAALTNSDTWPNKAGASGANGSIGSVNSAANPYATTTGVPGGRGSDASPGNVTGWVDGVPGAAGASGFGGAVVCVVAKQIVGSGKFISTGNNGNLGTAGTTGTAGSTGANGTTAPNLAYHVAPVHVAPTHIPSHHHGYARFADFHAHIVNPHPHQPGAHTPAQHGKYGHFPATNAPGHPYNSGHYHHTGSRHHPHSNDGHGVLTHIHNWPSVIHTAAKTNHAAQHSHPDTYGHFAGRVYHQHAGGHDGHIHAAQNLVGHTHTHANGHDLGGGHHGNEQGDGMRISGGHAHGPHHYTAGSFDKARHGHHSNPSTPQPNGHWTGGAGGINNGTTFGKGAPARTAPSGTAGSPGGGGAILVVTDSVSGTITYDTSGGALVSGATAATSGSAYILINT
jgi:hypothetical protein